MRSTRLLGILLLAACAGTAPAGTPSTVQPGVEAWAISHTQPQQRLRLVFDWSLQEEQARFSGEGVARVDSGYRARLDLFGPRGEAVAAAALVDSDLRLPPGANPDLLPPAALLWSVLGVIRPPDAATLVGAEGDSISATLVYQAADERWIFQLRNSRLVHAEWTGPSQGRQTVEIRERGERNLPSRVVYRDWRAFRELTLSLNQVYDSEPFPPETWTPGRSR